MKILSIVAFAVVAAIQLYVPASMILDREKIITDGKMLKFKTAPVDPSDPFRGKYIDLEFKATEYKLQNSDEEWQSDENVYVQLKKDEEGYAHIQGISKVKPAEGLFVKGSIQYMIPYENPEKLVIQYPFDRYYMEESKAYDAELTYLETVSDTSGVTYALVHVLDGEAVLTDVLIDDISILELIQIKN